jgi:hypothetical protein
MPLYLRALAVLIATALPISVQASSDEAWAKLRDTLVATCTTLAQAGSPDAEIHILPNEVGSEGYAVAIVTVSNKLSEDMSVCIYDKHNKTAELTTAFISGDE